jgi:hypothetical protein
VQDEGGFGGDAEHGGIMRGTLHLTAPDSVNTLYA